MIMRGGHMYKVRDRKFIGIKIKIRRKELSFSQEHLAEEIGITYQQLQRYENGTSNLNTDRLQAIANILDVPITYFFEEQAGGKIKIMERENPYFSPQERQFVETLRKIENTECRDCMFTLVKHVAGKK